MKTPAGMSAAQPANLPLPLPILEPATFLLRGKYGKTLNQALREVLSALRTAFLRNI